WTDYPCLGRMATNSFQRKRLGRNMVGMGEKCPENSGLSCLTGGTSIRPRSRDRGDPRVSNETRTSPSNFNSATVSAPWRSRVVVLEPEGARATSIRPRSRDRGDHDPLRVVGFKTHGLQFGHGLGTVEIRRRCKPLWKAGLRGPQRAAASWGHRPFHRSI